MSDLPDAETLLFTGSEIFISGAGSGEIPTWEISMLPPPDDVVITDPPDCLAVFPPAWEMCTVSATEDLDVAWIPGNGGGIDGKDIIVTLTPESSEEGVFIQCTGSDAAGTLTIEAAAIAALDLAPESFPVITVNRRISKTLIVKTPQGDTPDAAQITATAIRGQTRWLRVE